jgi:CubicO group peptidase (beta-lactamase class C family)
MRLLAFACWLLVSTAAAAQTAVPWCPLSTPEEQRLDAAAFVDFDRGIAERLADIQSVVVVLSGRVAYQYHRDGNPEALRDMQSVAKTALVALVGTALRQGHIASLDRQVVDLLPELRPINADPRTQAITLRHLLTMTAGFAVNDATGTAPPLAPAQAWARQVRDSPGEVFAYDNSLVNLVTAALEKATGRSVADYAREQLVQPLGMIEPSYQRGLQVRTVDMAKLGHLFLQDGVWSGRSLLPPGFAVLATQAVSGGGPPVQLPYGIAWWVPSTSTYFASGYAGQVIWVHAPLQAVVAVTSTVSTESQQRGQAMQLIRGRLFQAVQKRAAPSGR